jgi:hypothetical protein
MVKVYSKHRSVFFYVDMLYYQPWVPLFTPLDQQETNKFLNAVSTEEEQKGRWLTLEEVEKIMEGFIHF